MIHIKPPDTYSGEALFSIFLGGSIEMDKAEKWQERLVSDLVGEDVVIFNPRRDNWDASLPQDPSEGTVFREQVEWELNAQDSVDLIVYYFDPNTISPITLLELGAYGATDPDALVVYCPTNYFRYGNVKIFCDRYGIQLVHSYEELLNVIKEAIYDASF